MASSFTISPFISLIFCFPCLTPYHSIAKCVGRKGNTFLEHHREFNGMPNAPHHVSGLTLNHLILAGRLLQVAGLADFLASYVAMLRMEGYKAPLTTKVSQAYSRNQHLAEAFVCPSVSRSLACACFYGRVV
ncbi:hypothetical protein CCR75_000045 [Bremia lactucae]|uniref:Uncharacterized protein n=1 Tax=Bremia lactucae TaxID=4779 RepID=A0A976ID54_BRELC|nr:hypothetical protein CCR75_000045 [Bremia lactucae]